MIEFQRENNRNSSKLDQNKPMGSIDDDEVMIEPDDKPELEPIS